LVRVALLSRAAGELRAVGLHDGRKSGGDKEKMDYPVEKEYYEIRKPELLKRFDEESQYWKPVIVRRFGKEFADTILREAREEFEAFIPQIPLNRR
jgi:hypothetical protein